MADEICIHRATGLTLYVLVWRLTDGYVWDAGDEAFEPPSTWNDARVGACDIPLTEITGTGWYQGDFPAAGTGDYAVQVFEQAGGAPATADVSSGGMDVSWSGSRMITAYDQASRNAQYLT